MSPQRKIEPEASTLRFGKTKKLREALLCFLSQYDSFTVADALVFLTVAENPDVSPTQVSEELGIPLPRIKHIMYGLEKGRADNQAKAMGLIEVHQNPTPGFRMHRMLRLSSKGTKLFAQITGA